MPNLSFKQVNGDGVTTDLNFTFPYLSQNHIGVKVDGVVTAFTWVNSQTVRVSPAPANGSVWEVRRTTPITELLVDFANSSTLNEDDLDNGNLQALFAEQEISDFKVNSMQLASDGKMDAQTKIIKNVVDPAALQDAATKNYVDSTYAASPAGHSIGAHSDSVPRVAAAGDLVVANSTPKYDGLAVGGKGAVLVGEPTQSQKMAWLAVGADESFIESDATQSKGVKWTLFATKLVAKLLAILTTKGDLLVSTGATVQRKAVGNDGDVLTADSSVADGLSWLAPLLHGQCRLEYVSATSIKLARFNGRKILVKTGSSWQLRDIPSAGVTAANTSVYVGGVAGQNLAASTLYYVYLFDNAGTLTIDFRTTARATDATTGVEICSGVDTLTLVGMVRTNASSQFVWTAATRLVASWFNRRHIRAMNMLLADTSTTSGVYVELTAAASRPEFLAWSDEPVTIAITGCASNASAGNATYTSAGMDSVSHDGAVIFTPSTNGYYGNISAQWGGFVSEGYHYGSLMVASGGGFTSTWLGNSVAPTRCTIAAIVRI